MFVEEGFRIRFNNGEVIDFYAENAAQKDEWMHALSQAVGKTIAQPSAGATKGWTEMVLKREKSQKPRSNPTASSKIRQEPVVPQRKTSKDKELPARPAVDSRHSYAANNGPAMMTGALQEPQSPVKSALPRPSGHGRTESYQSSRSQNNSPVKQQASRARPKSMWA